MAQWLINKAQDKEQKLEEEDDKRRWTIWEWRYEADGYVWGWDKIVTARLVRGVLSAHWVGRTEELVQGPASLVDTFIAATKKRRREFWLQQNPELARLEQDRAHLEQQDATKDFVSYAHRRRAELAGFQEETEQRCMSLNLWRDRLKDSYATAHLINCVTVALLREKENMYREDT